jgi:acetyltransferase-like isoleucine patch superfamily enzyme
MAELLNKIKIVLTDFNGYAFKALRMFRLAINRYYGNLRTKTSLILKSVDFNKGCNFYGFSYFYRYPTSSIVIGKNCTFRSAEFSNMIGINRSCIISTHYKKASVIIGDKCGFSGVTINALSSVTIGNNLLCGANVLICDYDWHNTDPKRRYERCDEAKPIIIENNVFIGVNAIVWKGVTIGENSVIGANSVVTKSIPANVFAAGNPCKVIKAL